MGIVKVDISVSLDGYVAGPNQTLEEPLGEHGEELHEWWINTKNFAQADGGEGAETGVYSDVGAEHLAGVSATIMGRRMYSGGSGAWADDPKARGRWGGEPPLPHPGF